MIMAICNNKKCSLGECDQSETCAAYVPVITRVDKIRAMTDEELAELIAKHHPMRAWNKQVREIYFSFDDHRKDNPQRAWLDWLHRPAEGEE